MVGHMASPSVCPICSGQFITRHYVTFSLFLKVDKCQLICCGNWLGGEGPAGSRFAGKIPNIRLT